MAALASIAAIEGAILALRPSGVTVAALPPAPAGAVICAPEASAVVDTPAAIALPVAERAALPSPPRQTGKPVPAPRAATVPIAPATRTSRPATAAPAMGTLAVNALPWAEIWIDGQRAGETPMANLPVAAGPHVVRFVHPALGEQQRSIVIAPGQALRLGADLRK